MRGLPNNSLVPNNWILATFESVSEGENAIVDGPFGSNLKTSDYIDDKVNGVPVLTTKNLEGDYSDEKVRFISKSKFEELKRSQVKPGDILIAKIGSIGKNGIYPKNARTAIIPANLLKFTVSRKVVFQYIYYYINSVVLQNKIKSIATATAQPAFNVTKFRLLEIPLAPLPEQRAIVAKIEQLLSDLDNGIANLKTAKGKLEIYRQAVLKKAFEGELTKEWRSQNSVDRQNWKSKKLGEILKTIDGDRGKNYPKKDELLTEGYCLFLSTKNVRLGNFVFDENLFISEKKDKILRGGKLKRNDVVITTRGTLGNVAVYDNTVIYDNIRINSGMLILRVNEDSVLSQHYLMRYINSSLFLQQLKAKQSGTAQPQIPANILREIEIEIPDIKEQHLILEGIETRLSICDKLSENIDQSLEKSEALRQSILKKAFEGKLLSESELEACRQEHDWEPADKLLERIKKEKEKSSNITV